MAAAIDFGASPEGVQSLALKRANRHGLIAGATGTGKTVTLQVLAEAFARAGVNVFAADIKGDLSGCAAADAAPPEWAQARAALVGLPGLVHLSLTSGAHDAVLLVRCPDIEHLRDVVLVRLHEIPEVRSAQTLFVLDEERLPPLPPPEP